MVAISEIITFRMIYNNYHSELFEILNERRAKSITWHVIRSYSHTIPHTRCAVYTQNSVINSGRIVTDTDWQVYIAYSGDTGQVILARVRY
jgi:hypothetical protein